MRVPVTNSNKPKAFLYAYITIPAVMGKISRCGRHKLLLRLTWGHLDLFQICGRVLWRFVVAVNKNSYQDAELLSR